MDDTVRIDGDDGVAQIDVTFLEVTVQKAIVLNVESNGLLVVSIPAYVLVIETFVSAC